MNARTTRTLTSIAARNDALAKRCQALDREQAENDGRLRALLAESPDPAASPRDAAGGNANGGRAREKAAT